MYRRQVRRRRAVLVLLVAASVLLLSVHYSEGDDGPVHSIERSVASILAPIEEGASRALKPAEDLIDWFDETFEARGENDRLRTELAELRGRVVESRTAVGENEELRKLLELGPEAGVSGETVSARVIGRSPTVWYSTVTLDHGSSSGIQVDDPVVTGDGLAGRVSEVTAGTAEVTLITDPKSAVSARVLDDGPLGVVKPEVGDPDDLLLDFIEDDQEVKEGTTLVTSGSTASELESLFPPAIPIGRVIEASPGEQEIYQRVHVRPFAELREFDFAQVLVGGKAGSA